MHAKIKTVSTHAHSGRLTPRSLRSGGHLPPRALQDTGHDHRDCAACPTKMTPPRAWSTSASFFFLTSANFDCPFDHPKCQDEKTKTKKGRKKKRQGRDSQYSPCLCEGVAGRRPKAGDAFTQTRLMPAFRPSTDLHVEHRRPSRQRILSHHLSLTFLLGHMSKTAFVAILESCLRLVILTHGRVPTIT